MALKKAELSDEVVLRMVEMDGSPQENCVNSPARSPRPARSMARNMPSRVRHRERRNLVTNFTAYQPRTFALEYGAARQDADSPIEARVPTYDVAVSSNDDTTARAGSMATATPSRRDAAGRARL